MPVPQAPPAAIVIFGASGDLTQRKLVPALYTLLCEGHLSDHTHIVGIARTPMSDRAFRDRLFEGIDRYARSTPETCGLWPKFKDRFTYLSGDYQDLETYRLLARKLQGLDRADGCLYYLSTPPALYPIIVEHLGEAGLNRDPSGWRRIIIEKPFGHDLASSRDLNTRVHTVFDEDQIYRIDHYLGKETVQNILTFRFANAIFEPLWNRNYIDHVQITATEDVSVDHRGGYYDQAGVIRDMVQNHLFQLFALTALDPPAELNAKNLRDEKVKILKATRPLTPPDGILGQYRGYRDTPGVAPDSRTPTYCALKCHVDTWRWQGVPFYLRSGKSLARKITEITLQFKRVPHLLFSDHADPAPNRLSMRIQPDEGVHLRFGTKVPGAGMAAEPVDMDFRYDNQFGSLPDAYERLLLDALHSDAALFTREDEVERAWELVDPFLKTHEADPTSPLPEYEPGSWGPSEADALLKNATWLVGCQTCR